IRSGDAKLCMGIDDFVNLENKQTKIDENFEKLKRENNLLDALGINPVSESVLADVVKKTISEIKRDLVVLELQGLIQKVDGGYVRLS
ncbi:MAG: hypothetical protein ACLRFN_03045, partial [Alphaproteobacteria bacterium]